MAQQVGIEFIANDESLVSGFDKAIKKAEELATATESLNKGQEAAAKSAEMAGKASEVLGTGLNDAVVESKKLLTEQEQLNRSLKKQIGDIKIFGVSINDVTGKLKGWQSNLTGVVKGLVGTNKALGLFKIALAATGIGLIVVALGSLVAFLTRTQRGIDILSAASKGLGAAFEVLLDVAEGLGEALFDVFTNPRQAISDLADFLKTVLFDATLGRVQSLATAVKLLFEGDFQGAAKEAVDVLTGVNDTVDKVVDGTQSLIDKTKEVAAEIVEETKAAVALEKARQRLRDAEIALRIETAKSRAEIKELNKVAEDTTKSYDERREAASRAIAIEQSLLQRRIDLAQQNVDLIQRENDLSNNLVADNERLADAQIEVDTLRTESLELQTTLQNKLNTISQEQIRNTEALKKSLQELTNTLTDDIISIESENDPVIAVLRSREKAIDDIQKRTEEYLATAAQLGLSDDVIAATVGQFTKLTGLINDRAAAELAELRTIDGVAELAADVGIDIKPKIANIPEAKEELSEQIGGILDGLAEGFNSDEFQAFQTVTASITDALISGIDNQISELDRISEQRRDQIAELEDGLKLEQGLREQGFALNVKGKQQELEQLRSLEEADQKKRQELEAKAARVQLINDSIQQASSLSTAATNVFSGFSTIPFVGVPLGIAAVAAMFAAFAKIKLDAISATRLSTGSDRLYDDIGQVAPGEGSDVQGRGTPEFRIVDSKGNTRAVVGGEEMLVDGSTTLSHGKVMKWVRDNKMNMTANDMIKLLEGSPNLAAMRVSSPLGNHVSDLSLNVSRSHEKAVTEAQGGRYITEAEMARIMKSHSDKIVSAITKKIEDEIIESGNKKFVRSLR